jgi:hypothetical protein
MQAHKCFSYMYRASGLVGAVACSNITGGSNEVYSMSTTSGDPLFYNIHIYMCVYIHFMHVHVHVHMYISDEIFFHH